MTCAAAQGMLCFHWYELLLDVGVADRYRASDRVCDRRSREGTAGHMDSLEIFRSCSHVALVKPAAGCGSVYSSACGCSSYALPLLVGVDRDVCGSCFSHSVAAVAAMCLLAVICFSPSVL